MKETRASLNITMKVDCPKCMARIDLLDKTETDMYDHDDEGYLLSQIFPSNANLEEFECEEVTCTMCKETFNVKGMCW